MPTYRNGELPRSILVELDSGGGKHWTTRASAARWYALRAWVKAEYGVTLKITEGANAYRDLANQKVARQWACDRGNCLGAAYPGTSSHGGNWYRPGVGWVDAMAFDVGNWWLLTWDAWVKACARFGLLAGGIPLNVSGGVDERHHIIDLNPFGPVPAGLETVEFDDMATKQEIKDALYEVLTERPGLGPGNRNHWDSLSFLASMTAQAVTTAKGIKADLNYIHQVSPYSLKALLEASGRGEIVLSDEQVAAIGGQLSASAVAGIEAALADDFDGVKARLAELPKETIAALKAAL